MIPLVVVWSWLVLPGQAQQTAAVTLPSLVEEARQHNPALLAARERWQSVEAAIGPAKTWDSPEIGVRRADFQGGQKGTFYSLEQAVPFPGKLSTDGDIKRHEARIAHEGFRARELEVVSEVKSDYQRLLWLDRTSRVLQRESEILRTVARVAQSQVSSGQSRADEALIAQALAKEAENAVFERQQQKLIEEEDLNALLAAPAGTHRVLADLNELPDVPMPIEELSAVARAENPSYLATLDMVHHAELQTRRERLSFAPDFKINASVEQAPDVPMMEKSSIGVNLSIPLWFWSQSGRLRSAKAHAKEAVADSQDAQNAVFKNLYKEYTQVQLHRKLALSYLNEILPLTEGGLKIAQKNYETGRIDYVRFFEAVRSWLEAQMKYYEEAYRYGEHWAMLERVAGRELAAGEKK